jgi:hypothetical protein
LHQIEILLTARLDADRYARDAGAFHCLHDFVIQSINAAANYFCIIQG